MDESVKTVKASSINWARESPWKSLLASLKKGEAILIPLNGREVASVRSNVASAALRMRIRIKTTVVPEKDSLAVALAE